MRPEKISRDEWDVAVLFLRNNHIPPTTMACVFRSPLDVLNSNECIEKKKPKYIDWLK